VLRHNGVWRAKRNQSVRSLRVRRRVGVRQLDVANRAIRTVCHEVETSELSAVVSSVAHDSESGAAVRTPLGGRPRRGAGFTSIQ
jgi:hypothetical protein